MAGAALLIIITTLAITLAVQEHNDRVLSEDLTETAAELQDTRESPYAETVLEHALPHRKNCGALSSERHLLSPSKALRSYWHFSLTILRAVTLMSPASAALFFSCSSASPFSFSADSGLSVPVIVTS